MTNITEDYVSFETAKLLKEKGFDENTPVTYFIGDDKPRGCVEGEMVHHKKSENDTHLIACPTIQMAMKWLRVKGYQIIVKHTDNNGYFANILTMDNAHQVNKLFDGYNTYEEACEVAIKYCLENLI